MPLKRGDNKKRYVSSDSEDASSIYDTPKRGSVAKRSHKDTTMVTETTDIRFCNGKVNGLSVDNTALGPNMTPVVVLNDIAGSKRKSFGFNSIRVTPITERDEREQRLIRQTERAAQHRRSAVGLVATPNRMPSTTSIVMSADKLKEHYTHCIQLLATNKINIKNAFGLHLIDHLSELIKQAEQNQQKGFVNFKLAGTALDAGAKIYCHRVDSVHAEAQKVASSLAMALNNDKNPNNNENGNQNEEGMDGIDEQNEGMNNEEVNRPKRKKATRRNLKIIAQNTDTLNVVKVEANLEIDPVFHHLSDAFDMGNVNSLLMANLKINPSGMLLVDSNSSDNFDNLPINSEPLMQPISKFYDILNDVSKSSSQICPKLSIFEFLNRDNGIDLIPREEDPSSARKDDFAFDLNADVEDIDMDSEDNPHPDGFENFSDSDSDSDGGGLEAADSTMKKSMSRALNMQGVGDLVKMLSEKPNDYSYFNPKLMGARARPNHWKRIPFRKDRLDGQPVDGDRPRRQRRLFPEVDYTRINEFDEQVLNQICEKMLKISTLDKWKSHHIELRLPADHGFDPKSLTTSFIKKETIFYCAKNNNNEDVMENTITSEQSYGPPASPGVERYDDDDDIPMGGFTDPLELGTHSLPLSQINANTNDMMAFIGDNLVEQPYDLQQYNITFAKFAKKMDVKKLKRAMWDVISPIQEIETHVLPETHVVRKSSTNLQFMDLYKSLPQKITPVMAQNLSAPIAFVTILHLCNERNLKLIRKEDLSDFVIETED